MSKTPPCSECDVKTDVAPGCEEADAEFVRAMCGECPRKKQPDRKRKTQLIRLLDYLVMQDNQCPIGRNELRDEEWMMLGPLRDEREKVRQEEWKKEKEKRDGHDGEGA